MSENTPEEVIENIEPPEVILTAPQLSEISEISETPETSSRVRTSGNVTGSITLLAVCPKYTES